MVPHILFFPLPCIEDYKKNKRSCFVYYQNTALENGLDAALTDVSEQSYSRSVCILFAESFHGF